MFLSMENKRKNMRAIWGEVVLAESDRTILIEDNHYFPPESVNRDYLRESGATTFCPWKGHASYYDIVVNTEVNSGTVWFYPEPLEAAKEIKDHLAFWKGVEIIEVAIE